MDNKQMIDDFVKMMDSGMAQGVGHVNVDVDDKAETSKMSRQWAVRIVPVHPLPAASRLSRRGSMTTNRSIHMN